MFKFLLLGKDGQVGWELQRSLALWGDVLALGRYDMGGDFFNCDGVIERIESFSPDVVFNAAAYTAVDLAESNVEEAFLVNATAVGKIALACKKRNAVLVHYSTDYVFDGTGVTAWTEQSIPSPLNTYGKSKLKGERLIAQSACHSLIFRTSWIYGVHGNNFVKTILQLSQQKESLFVVKDQIGTPTSAEFVADVSTFLAIKFLREKANILGTYHLVPNGETSWFDFAKWIVKEAEEQGLQLRLAQERIFPVLSHEVTQKARRPLNSRLNNEKMKSVLFDNVVKDWRFYAKRILMQLINNRSLVCQEKGSF